MLPLSGHMHIARSVPVVTSVYRRQRIQLPYGPAPARRLLQLTAGHRTEP
ncbi:hypothetical protein ABZ318_17900 [Streptomyces sp. NPDC006197]